jgi:hypothetical protein
MTWWTVSTKEKKNVFEHELWQKDDWVIRRITGFRWGTILVETEGDEPPVLDQDSGPGADAVNMYDTEYNYELDSLDDGWYGDVIWPDDMPEEERDRLEAIWDEDWSAGWEEEGWDQYDTECWFHGPLEIVRDDNIKEWDEDISVLENEEEVINEMPIWPFPEPKETK